MTAGKAIGLTAAFIGVFALGVAVGPSMTEKMSWKQPAGASVKSQPAAESARAETPRTSNKPRAGTIAAPKASATVSIPASEPRLHARLKPVLNRGTKMEVASDGFRSAEQFATVAHASRNTEVPFMLLKHRVLTEGRTLEAAIHESKPGVDAKAEVKRAQADAKSDLDAIAS